MKNKNFTPQDLWDALNGKVRLHIGSRTIWDIASQDKALLEALLRSPKYEKHWAFFNPKIHGLPEGWVEKGGVWRYIWELSPTYELLKSFGEFIPVFHKNCRGFWAFPDPNFATAVQNWEKDSYQLFCQKLDELKAIHPAEGEPEAGEWEVYRNGYKIPAKQRWLKHEYSHHCSDLEGAEGATIVVSSYFLYKTEWGNIKFSHENFINNHYPPCGEGLNVYTYWFKVPPFGEKYYPETPV